MAREDVYVPRFEPAAVDYNPDNIDRNFNEVRDTIERLRDSANSQSDETVSDLTALEGTVTTISEAVYEPTTGLAATRARLITEEGVRATEDSALAARATTLEATVNDGTTGLVATRARLITEESTRASADSALASRATTLEAKTVADQQADFLSNGGFLRGTSGWTASGGLVVVPQTPEGVSGRNGVGLELTSTSGVQYYETQFPWPTWRAVDLAWTGITTLWNGGSPAGASIRVYMQGRVGAGSWTTIANTAAFTDIISLTTPKTLRATGAAGWDTLRLLFEINPPTSGTAQIFVLTQRVSNWTGEFPSLDMGPRALIGTEARIATEETVRATEDSALAARATTLEATVNDGTTGLVATRARLITEESTRASADSALSARSTTLEARFSNPFINIVRNPSGEYGIFTRSIDPSDGNWWFTDNAIVLGIATADLAGGVHRFFNNLVTPQTRNFYSELFPNNSTDMVFGGMFFNNQTSGSAVFQIFGYTSAGASFGPITTRDINGNNPDTAFPIPNLSAWTRVERRVIPSDLPVGCTQFRIVLVWTSYTGYTGFNRLQAHYGTVLPAFSPSNTEDLVATRARLITEESTRASADSALASSISTVSAKTDGRPNLFPVPTPSPNQTPAQLGWQGTALTTTNAPWVGGLVYYHVRPSGGSAATEFWFYDIPDLAVITNLDQYTLSAYGYGGLVTSGDRLQMYLEIRDSTNTSVIHVSPLVTLISDDIRFSTTTTFSGAPTNCRIRVVFRRDYTASGSFQDTVFNMIKVENGLTATAFTNSAQVNVQAGAIATLNSSAAFYQILVAASGGDPAIIRLFSGLGGSEVAIAARVLSLINTSSGANMEVMRAVGGEAFFSRPLSVDFGGRRLTIGPGFGVSGSQVVLWFGPSTIAPASQSRTNGTFALGTDGIVYYGGDLIQTGSMQMTLSSYAVNLTRLGTGNTSTSVTATGFAPGTLSYTWALHSGDGVNIGSPSSATTTIGHTLTALGQTKTSVVKCTVTSSAGPTTFQLFNISSSEIS